MEADSRRFEALSFLFDYSKGTLWWVNDRIWSEAIPKFVQKRKAHPGLSLSRKNLEGIYSVVPMAIGTSKNPGGSFPVKGLSKDGVHDAPAYFHVLRPYPLRFDEFGHADGIVRNPLKPRLSGDEVKERDMFLGVKEVRNAK